MGALIAAAIVAALVAAAISFFFGEKNGQEIESGKPRTVCNDYTLVSSTATHGDYAAAGGETFSVRKDELAARLGRETLSEFPKKLRVCVTIVAGEASTQVSVQ